MSEFQINKKSYETFRKVELDMDTERLSEDEVIVKIDKFGLSANNMTYAVVGEQFGYWQFFPPHISDNANDKDEWGVLPVWGFADVVKSNHAQVPVGERIFGYFPPASYLKLKPSSVSDMLWVDDSSHRQALPQGYNLYRRVNAEPGYHPSQEEERMLLFPLHVTGFALYDYFSSNNWFDATQIILISASSKTSTGMAYGIANDQNAPYLLGLTSKANVDAVNGFNVYDECLSYDDIEKIDASKPSCIVDMSGNKSVLGRLHKHLGKNLTFCSNVGFTHWDQGGQNTDINQEKSSIFFAPSIIQQRIKDWGMEGFNQRSAQYMAHSFARSREWIKMTEYHGLEGMVEIFPALCEGKVSPEIGIVIKM